ncbi:NAD(P)/FAD-dependent oxidoreductase [Aphanothece sacrum]|uniref:FAD dependent oxidoreductase n=1 Tax=Aphanothece sacrum FPU1 TaxID=1920663 RepID=A0A401INN4_APHSA|nr:NAD(P)/FAD-dependent oxidoreductase [Aphanothece sacrum]GBF82880.1 FAD dependent oxidoreductase [Aphanothece sacrum FPU1]GBF85985.1 FAD-dependent pyridine nucleotide-disulphide oxidoreductase [Aphanothece sacrum FPU3]
MNNKPLINICVLGGGFGGLYTALSLTRFSEIKSGQYQITLVERNDSFLFTPLLYELITGELQRWEIAPSYQKLLAGTPIKLCQNTVEGIDLKTRQVKLDDDQLLSYDYLILGVGTQNRWADIPGLKNNALTFRTLADVERLQTQLHLLETSERQRIRLAVIGAGPNGIELSCKLADRLGKRGEIVLIERGNEILKWFSQGVRSASYKALDSRRIQLYRQTNVNKIAEDSITLIRQKEQETLPIDLVIWVGGTQSRSWIKALNCQQNAQGKLLTLPTLQLMDYPEVFALGDLAEIHQTKQQIPATAQVAYQQASCAAKNLIALIKNKPLKAFYYLHLGDMLTLGKGEAIVSSFCLNIEGYLGSIIRRLAYIFRLPTTRHRLQVLRNLLQKSLLKIRRFFRWRLTRLLLAKSAKNY